MPENNNSKKNTKAPKVGRHRLLDPIKGFLSGENDQQMYNAGKNISGTVSDAFKSDTSNLSADPKEAGKYKQKSHSYEAEIDDMFKLAASAKKSAKSEKDMQYWDNISKKLYQYKQRIQGHESTGNYLKGSKVIDEIKSDKILGEYYSRYKSKGTLGTGINNKSILPKFDANAEWMGKQPKSISEAVSKLGGNSNTAIPVVSNKKTAAPKQEMQKVVSSIKEVPRAPISTQSPLGAPANNNPLSNADTEAQQKSRLGTYGIGDLADLARFGVGLHGALKELPEFKKPAAWNDYVGKMERLSNIGFTPEEWTSYTRDNERNYAMGVGNVMNAAGGNAGAALGNLNAAAGQLQTGRMRMGVEDANIRRQNLANYGNVLQTDVSMDRQIFDNKYNGIAASKQAGAGLASEALQNFVNRRDYNRTYEDPNSMYQQMQNESLKGLKYENDIRSRQLSLPDETFMKVGNVTPTSTTDVINPLTGRPYTQEELIATGKK